MSVPHSGKLQIIVIYFNLINFICSKRAQKLSCSFKNLKNWFGQLCLKAERVKKIPSKIFQKKALRSNYTLSTQNQSSQEKSPLEIKTSNLDSSANLKENANYFPQNYSFENKMAYPQYFGSMFVLVPVFQQFFPQRISFL